MSDPCLQESAIKMMDKKLDRMDIKLDLLLREHWKNQGKNYVISGVIAFIVSIIGFVIKG